MHNNEMVYKKTCEILTEFFEQEEEEDLNVLIQNHQPMTTPDSTQASSTAQNGDVEFKI
jgi:hypothetical protein